MKKAILLILFLISLKVSAQQTFWTPGVPPGSTSFSPTFRFNGTDSLAKIFLAIGNKTYQVYTAVQIKNLLGTSSILNQTTLQPLSNFWISGIAKTSTYFQAITDASHLAYFGPSGSVYINGLFTRQDVYNQTAINGGSDNHIITNIIYSPVTGVRVVGMKYVFDTIRTTKTAIDSNDLVPLKQINSITTSLSSIYATKDTLNNFVKRRFGVIHLADTAALKLYADTATDVNVVDTTGTGGNFTYFPTISKSDGGIWYKSSSLPGSWKRQYNEAAGINVAWFAGYPRSTLTTHIDQRAGIQRAFNSQYLRSGLFYFPSTRDKKWYGIASEIVMGQTTRFLGDAPSFPIQINTTTGDTVIYVSPSTIYPYNRTRAIRTDTTLNYRPQLPYFENITVYGTGKADGQTGIDMLSNPNYVTTNINSKDVGLGMMKNVYIDNFKTALDLHRADTYWIQHCQFSDVQVGLRGGKQDLRIDKVCFFNCDTALVSPSRYSNYGPGNEVQPSATGVGFVIGGKPENDATVAQFNIVNENQFGTAKRPLILNNGAQYNTIIGNHFITTSIADNFIRLDSAGRYNSVQSNKFGTATSNLIYARKTDRFTVIGNTYTGAPATGTSPVKADSCLLIQIGNNYDVTYGVTAKFQGIGSTTQDIFTSNNTQIYGFTDFNPNPGFTVRAFGGSPTTPTAVASGQDLGAFHSFGYNGTAGNERAGMYITAVEAFTSSANGTQIAWGVTQVGTTSRTNYLTLSRPAGANALLNLTGDIKNSGLVTFSNFTTAGILHNAVTTGSVSSSLIASADLGSSLALPGNPTTTTQTTSDNTTKIATTAFVKAQGYVNSVTTANGVSASNTAGALSFTLGAITPTSVAAATSVTGTDIAATNSLSVVSSRLVTSALFENDLGTAAAAIMRGGDATHAGVIFQNPATTQVAAVYGDGHAIFNSTVSGSKLITTAPSAYTSGGYSVAVVNTGNGNIETIPGAIHGNSTTTGTATTVVTVTIGNTMANTTYNTSITARDLLTAVNYYISNQTTTTFDVTFVTALTGSINFDWQVTP